MRYIMYHIIHPHLTRVPPTNILSGDWGLLYAQLQASGSVRFEKVGEINGMAAFLRSR
jgi:hypothetical protein